jgi:hypothetical protein
VGDLAVPEVGAVGQERAATGFGRGKPEAPKHRGNQAQPRDAGPRMLRDEYAQPIAEWEAWDDLSRDAFG